MANLGTASPYVTSGGITTLQHDGETVTLFFSNGSSNFSTDINLYGNDELTITVTEYNINYPALTPWAVDNYQLTADFKS